MQETSNNPNTAKIVGAVAISAVLIIGAYVFLTKDLQANKATTSKKGTTVSSVSKVSDNSTSGYQPSVSSSSSTGSGLSSGSSQSSSSSSTTKDGTYKASANYYVPRGFNTITVSVSVKGGAVTKVSTSHDYSDRESGMYTDSFDSSISSKAVGQKIDGLSLSRVGGASLTTEAFDEAISQIANQAKS